MVQSLRLILVLFQFAGGLAGPGQLCQINLHGNADPGLANTLWKWQQTVYSKNTRIFPPNPEHYTLMLMSDGKVNIRADCNLGGGVYIVRDQEISIEITHTTKAACPPGSLEQSYIRDLNGASSYRMEDDCLFIDLRNDTGTMTFMR